MQFQSPPPIKPFRRKSDVTIQISVRSIPPLNPVVLNGKPMFTRGRTNSTDSVCPAKSTSPSPGTFELPGTIGYYPTSDFIRQQRHKTISIIYCDNIGNSMNKTTGDINVMIKSSDSSGEKSTSERFSLRKEAPKPLSSSIKESKKSYTYNELRQSKAKVKSSILGYALNKRTTSQNSQYSSSRKSSNCNFNDRVYSATRIQAVIRKWLVIHNFEIYEKKRIDGRYLTMRQTLSEVQEAINNINYHKTGRKQYQIASKKLDILCNELRIRGTTITRINHLLTLLCKLLMPEHMGILTRSDFRNLVFTIINLPVTEDEITKVLDSLDRSYKNTITFTSFLQWFISYYQNNHITWMGKFAQKRRNKSRIYTFQYQRCVTEYLKAEYVEVFLHINLSEYDKRNPPLCKCKYCNSIFETPLRLVRHSCMLKNQRSNIITYKSSIITKDEKM